MKVARFLPRFRGAYSALPGLEERESWGRADIEAYQLDRLNELWSHARAHVAYYRALAQERGLPERFESLEQFSERMPILGKQSIRERGEAFLSDRAGRGRWHRTGGSTNTPTRVFRSSAEQQAMLWCRYRFLQAWGVDIFDRMAFLWGHGASFAPGLQGKIARVRMPIEDRLRCRLRLSAYHLGRDDLKRHLDRLVAYEPKAIYAYSSAGYLLAREAEARGVRLPSLRMVNLAAEPAYPHIVAGVERAFGVPAVQEYGSVECGFIAGDMPPGRRLCVREDRVLIETLPREDGRFDIIVTPLGSHCFPLIRYRIGDVTDAPLDKPDTGFAALSNVAGRDNDLLICLNDQPVHPFQLEDLIEAHTAVRRYQVRQTCDGTVRVFLELVRPAADLNQAELSRQLCEHVGYPVHVEIIDVIQGNAAGKHRNIISDLAVARTKGRRHDVVNR